LYAATTDNDQTLASLTSARTAERTMLLIYDCIQPPHSRQCESRSLWWYCRTSPPDRAGVPILAPAMWLSREESADKVYGRQERTTVAPARGVGWSPGTGGGGQRSGVGGFTRRGGVSARRRLHRGGASMGSVADAA